MRGKRSKQYRKLMQQYGLHFGFREPYQVLFDADILLEAARCRMNLIKMLESTLHGEVKPMITHCCMRHLYNAEPKNEIVVEHAKQFEKRRCNHHTLDQPLSTLQCMTSVLDPKGSRTNKHRYVVATQDQDVQEHMQSIPGVPLVYIVRSVMIMKPMSTATAQTRAREETAKFRQGLKGGRNAGSESKSRSEQEANEENHAPQDSEPPERGQPVVQKKPPRKTQPAPNPLSSRAPSKAKLEERERSGKASSGTTRRKRKNASRVIMDGQTAVTATAEANPG